MSDGSHDMYLMRVAVADVAHEQGRPSVLFRPRVFPDGNQWCCLLGDNLQAGVAGFGDTPDEACVAFDKAWVSSSPPPVRTTS